MIKHGDPPYLECSSRGDRRFSAFYAYVDGQSIEKQYQEFKVFETESGDFIHLTAREAKGKKAYNQVDAAEIYRYLWNIYIREHPELLEILLQATGLSDMFGQEGHCCQATELWRIRNEHINK